MKQTEEEYANDLIKKHASIITELADDIEDIVIQCAIQDVENTIEALSKLNGFNNGFLHVLFVKKDYYQNVLHILKDKL